MRSTPVWTGCARPADLGGRANEPSPVRARRVLRTGRPGVRAVERRAVGDGRVPVVRDRVSATGGWHRWSEARGV
ncbi:MAG TPA: hypothetical protein VLB49_13910 [Gemmatimonadales bacterium]|nr:hypothetical protein [Gemmatimonadales bacterium]